jgi:tetratricopeptide (TPR) repeat protein/predicted Ser/Thr protein kinase
LIAERFEIERQIGAGGMGTVYRARDRARASAAAVKVVRSSDAHVVERFAREARILEQLAHPTIVGYITHGKTPDGALFLAMEWLEGEDLGTRLDAGKLTAAETLACASQIAGALAIAHARGIVHRDLKPTNVFLVAGQPQQAKLLDFGIARIAELDALTRTGALVGTPLYMAPEQVNGGEIDARTDVFALGAVMFHCLSGRPPFPAKNLPELVGKLACADEAPRVRTLEASVPAALDELIARMLAKDPARRPANGKAVADAIVDGGIHASGLATAETGIVEMPSISRSGEQLSQAQELSKAGKWQEARAAYEAAITLEDSAVARFGLANVLTWLNEMVDSMEHYERAYALATRSTAPDAPILAAAIALTLGIHHKKTFGNASAARGWLARGSRMVPDDPAHPLYGMKLMIQGACADDSNEAVALLTKCLEHARNAGQRDAELSCLAFIGAIRVMAGDMAGMPMLDEAMAATMGGEYKDLQTVVGVACSMVTACDAVADIPRLVEWCTIAEKFADKFGCPYLYADCRWHYGSGLVATGKWSEAELELKAAMSAAPIGTLYHIGAAARLADLRVRQGRLDEAEQLLADVGDKPIARGVAGSLKHARGQHAAATALLQRYLDASPMQVHSAAQALETLVDVAIARDDLQLARFASKRLTELAPGKTKTVAAHADLAAGRLALAEGDPAGARKHFERAIDLFLEQNLPHEAARARMSLARALAGDNTELAREEVRAASHAFAQLGATHDASAAAELLRTLGA